MDQIRIFDLIAIRFKDFLPGHTFVFAGDLAQRAMAAVNNCREILTCMSLSLPSIQKHFIIS
jgi:hypothetical protein